MIIGLEEKECYESTAVLQVTVPTNPKKHADSSYIPETKNPKNNLYAMDPSKSVFLYVLI